jgi:hypothetical protein
LHAHWRRGELAVTIAPEVRERLSRRARVAELAELVRDIAGQGR